MVKAIQLEYLLKWNITRLKVLSIHHNRQFANFICCLDLWCSIFPPPHKTCTGEQFYPPVHLQQNVRFAKVEVNPQTSFALCVRWWKLPTFWPTNSGWWTTWVTTTTASLRSGGHRELIVHCRDTSHVLIEGRVQWSVSRTPHPQSPYLEDVDGSWLETWGMGSSLTSWVIICDFLLVCQISAL